jgi:hypothetical protein
MYNSVYILKFTGKFQYFKYKIFLILFIFLKLKKQLIG